MEQSIDSVSFRQVVQSFTFLEVLIAVTANSFSAQPALPRTCLFKTEALQSCSTIVEMR